MGDSLTKIGFLTIGQSPRVDVTSDIKDYLKGLKIVEAGALDDYSREYIEERLAPEENEVPLITRMRDGSSIRISEEKIIPLLQEKISLLEEKGVEAIAILCSGTFPEFKSRVPIIYPDLVLKSYVAPLISENDILGVIAPLPEQEKYIKEKWLESVGRVAIEFASPYSSTKEHYITCCKSLLSKNVKAVVLDCIGYSSSIKRLVREITELPVISTRTSLANYLRELYL